MPGKRGIFNWPTCGQKVKYSRTNLSKYLTEDGRLRCKVRSCNYILSKKEIKKVEDSNMVKKT